MPTATVISQGRVTIPAQVRIAMGLRTGLKIEFVAVQGGYRLVVLSAGSRSLRGRFAGRVANAVPLAVMEMTVAAGATKRGMGLL